VVLELESVLPPSSTVFEYGVGQGTNSIYLAGKGFNVDAQDISSEMIVELVKHATKAQVRLNVHCSEAQDHTLSRSYTAFVSTYILHFLPPTDAMRVLRNMQANTITGGYNAHEFHTPMS
jgi:tellurite methyltransferase